MKYLIRSGIDAIAGLGLFVAVASFQSLIAISAPAVCPVFQLFQSVNPSLIWQNKIQIAIFEPNKEDLLGIFCRFTIIIFCYLCINVAERPLKGHELAILLNAQPSESSAINIQHADVFL